MTIRLSASGPAAPKAVRWAWLIFGGIITVALLASAAVLAGRGMGPRSEQSTIAEPGLVQTVSVQGSSAHVRLSGADIDSLSADANLVWYSVEPVIDTTWQDTDLLVELTCRSTGIPIWFLPGCSIDFAAQVPQTAGAEVKLSSGSITVEDLDGDLNLQTDTGRIEGSDLSGSVYARTVSGEMSASGLSSDADVATDSGDIWLEFSEAPARIQADSVSGNVDILVPRGKSYRILTSETAREVDVQVASDPDSDSVIELSTEHGRVTVEYAP